MIAQIVVVGKNGQDGGRFPVSEDVLLGRYVLNTQSEHASFESGIFNQNKLNRKEDCDIRINLTSCSRHHAQFIVQKVTGEVSHIFNHLWCQNCLCCCVVKIHVVQLSFSPICISLFSSIWVQTLRSWTAPMKPFD